MPRRLVPRLAAAVGTALALALSGCVSGVPPQAHHVVVTDLSGSASTLGPVLAHELERSLQTAAAAGARLTVLPVTADSAGDPSGVVVIDLGAPLPENTPDNALFRERHRQQLVSDGLDQLRQWLAEHALSHGSDYHGALVRVGQVLDDVEGPATVTFVGDGLSTNLVDLKPNLDPNSCGDAAREARAAGQLPDLTGVTVRWVGGGRSDTPQDPQLQAALQGCWEQVIHSIGGATPPGWWTPAPYVTS